jgi:hypothetical protein
LEEEEEDEEHFQNYDIKDRYIQRPFTAKVLQSQTSSCRMENMYELSAAKLCR